jgi:hypothetical protein
LPHAEAGTILSACHTDLQSEYRKRAKRGRLLKKLLKIQSEVKRGAEKLLKRRSTVNPVVEKTVNSEPPQGTPFSKREA